METALNKTPELRFPEFKKEDSNLKVYRFDDIFLFSTGKNIKQKEASPEFEIPCVRYGELYHLYKEVIRRVINRTNLNKSELHFSEGNEVLLPSAGEDPLDIGSASALTIPNIAIGRTINILKPKYKSLYSQIFVSYYINQKLKKKISTLAKGVSISNVYNSDLKNLVITLPLLAEQQKIANFLSSVDTKIEQLNQKKRLLEQYKKGVMQQIFSQQLRFKDEDGNDFPDWEERKVSELFRITRGQVLATTKVVKVKNKSFQFPVYSSQTTNEGLMGFYNDFLFEDCITWTTDGANAGVTKFRVGKFYCTNVCGVLVSENGHANQMIAEKLNTVTKRHVSYVGNPKLMNNVMGGIKILIPKSLKEQTQIANFLCAIDKKIDLVNTQLENTQAFKKGLLQQMFV